MASKAVDLRIDDVKTADTIEMKIDLYKRLTANVEEADKMESEKILDEICELKNEDLEIVSIESIML